MTKKTVAPNSPTLFEWAERINGSWRRSRDAVFETGRQLIEAKAALPHGEFQMMVESDLDFAPSTARRLMAIASDERLSKRAHVNVLPTSWGTLYELTKLDNATLERLIDDGTIRPDMPRRVVKSALAQRPTDAAPELPTCTVAELDTLIAAGHKFGTVYADPPWLYGNQGTRAATGNHYGGMTVAEIASLPIAELTADAAHLHLWTTNGFLFEARDIIEAWGFTYKSCFVWAKPKIGIGNYWRVSHEFMLLGVKGTAPFQDRSQRSWIECDRGRHSAKPEQVRHIIEKTSPGPRLELFARMASPGWVAWGNETGTSLLEQGIPEFEAAS